MYHWDEHIISTMDPNFLFVIDRIFPEHSCSGVDEHLCKICLIYLSALLHGENAPETMEDIAIEQERIWNEIDGRDYRLGHFDYVSRCLGKDLKGNPCVPGNKNCIREKLDKAPKISCGFKRNESNRSLCELDCNN